jgi:predicted lactoylglutathione lyase
MNNEQKPAVWVGHISLETDQLEASTEFTKKIGIRFLGQQGRYAVMELRGGTHLILIGKDKITPQPAPFDLMVDDLEASHQQFTHLGLQPSPIEKGRIHSSFTIKEPAGNTIKINSSHVSRFPV